MIYTEEAHAIDEWYIGESAGVILESHKTLDDREKCIETFRQKYNIKFPIYPDDMNSTLMNDFSSWPVRCYIIKDNIIKYISEPKFGEVDFCEIFQIALEL